MKTIVSAGLLSLVLATQAGAHETATTRLSEPGSDDIAAAKAVTDSFIETLEGGDTEAAIRQVAAKSKLFSEKQQQVNLVIAQAKNADLLYGKVQECVASKYTHESEFRLEFHYICQHEELLIEWTLKVDKLPSGWSISNFSFTDSF